MKTIKCDICGNVFTVPSDELVAYLKHYDFKEEQKQDLCIDCSSLIAMVRSPKWYRQFAKLAEKLSQ